MTFEQRVALLKPLNTNEVEVLQELADGLGTAEIAANRRTTAQVIKNCTYRACQKLGADNRAHLIPWRFVRGSFEKHFSPVRCARMASQGEGSF
jgi:DNA-binding NarL/FixJ family response regulator